MWLQEQIDVCLQNTQYKYVKIQILNWNEEVVDEIEGVCLSGSINIDATQIVRRTLDITLKSEKNLIPSPTSKIWLNKKLRVFVGIKSIRTNEIIWFNQGIYILLKPSLKFSASENTLSLQALDKMCWLNGQLSGKLQNITRIPEKTPMFEGIKTTICQLGQEDKFIIDDLKNDEDKDLLIPYKIEKNEDETVADVLNEIKELYMFYEYYYDIDGRFHFERIKNRKNDIVKYDFNDSNVVLDYSNEPNWENIKNDIMVWGRMSEEGKQIQYHIENTDNSSRFSIDNIKRRKFTVKDDKVFTDKQAKIRAEYELFLHSSAMETIVFNTVPLYFLEVNDKIRIEKLEVDIHGDYLIDKISFPLDISGNMSITAHKLYYEN